MSTEFHTAVVEITNRCNLSCIHCASNSGEAREMELSVTEFDGIFSTLKRSGFQEVVLLGGEIFMRKDWLLICESVRESGLDYVLITNGVMLPHFLPKLLHVKPVRIGVSIDGATRESYSNIRRGDHYDTVLKTILGLPEHFDQVSAITTFMHSNLADFDRFVSLWENSPIVWQIQMAHKAGERFPDSELLTNDDYAWLVDKVRMALQTKLETLKLQLMDDFGYHALDPTFKFINQLWSGCQAGKRTIGIRSNGDVLGCLSLGDAFIEANCRAVPLEEILLSGKYFSRFAKRKLQGQCAFCPVANDCGAGCTAMAFHADTGCYDNPFCIRKTEMNELFRNVV